MPPTFVLPAGRITTSGQDVTFDFSDVQPIVNNDNDAGIEYVTIEFNALVNNTANTNAGNAKSNTFDLYRRRQSDRDVSPAVNVTLLEPAIPTPTKVIVGTTPSDAGDVATYDVSYTNTSTATATTAFDVRMLDTLNATYFGSATVVSVTLGGGAAGVTNNSSGNIDRRDGGHGAGERHGHDPLQCAVVGGRAARHVHRQYGQPDLDEPAGNQRDHGEPDGFQHAGQLRARPRANGMASPRP